MKRSLPLLLGIAALIVALDQWTKHWATDRLAYREPIHLIGDFASLTYTRNSGIAFGLGAGLRFPFYVFSIVAAVAILVLFFRAHRLSLTRHLSLALILGGAIGNLIDRVATGEVVDFILLKFGHWHFPVFNVADSAVTLGVAIFALAWTGEAPSAPADHGLEPPGEPGHPTFTSSAAHDPNGTADGPADERGGAGRPLSREGADRPVA